MKGCGLFLWVLLGCLSLWCFAPAIAPGNDPGQRFEHADRLYKAGEYQEALKGFKDLYVETGEAALLFNIAQCHRQLKQFDDAIKAYKSYLREVPDTDLKDQVNELIKECEAGKQATPTNTPTSTPTTALSPKDPPATPSQKPAYILYGASGGLAIASFVVGRTAILQAEQAQNLSIVSQGEAPPDPAEVVRVSNIARRAATISTFSLAASLGCAAGGFVLQKKAKAPKASAVLTPTGGALQVRF